MSQNQNQFSQSAEKGMMDLRFNPSVVSCQIDSTSASGLVAGQAVKMVDDANGVPQVVECAANSDDVFGFLTYDIRRATFDALDYVEVAALRGNVIYLEASAAIARWARVAIVVSGSKVVTASAAMTVVGRAFDKASGNGSLIRVVVDLPGESYAESAFVQAANVAALAGTLTGTVTGTMVDVPAVAISSAGGNTYADTTVNTAVNLAVTALNVQLKELQTKINAEIAALKTALLQASA